MVAIPGRIYRKKDGRLGRFTDIVVVALAHDFRELHRELVVYRFADTDAETGLCYYMPLPEFEANYEERE
jgi:hypothetical protein